MNTFQEFAQRCKGEGIDLLPEGIALLEQVKAFIMQEAKHFRMFTFAGVDDYAPQCGTVLCLGGACVYLHDYPEIDLMGEAFIDLPGDIFWIERQAETLLFGRRLLPNILQDNPLFYEGKWRLDTYRQYHEAWEYDNYVAMAAAGCQAIDEFIAAFRD